MLNLANVLIEMSRPIYLLQIEINFQATGVVGRTTSRENMWEHF